MHTTTFFKNNINIYWINKMKIQKKKKPLNIN
jgi:hypothetical protein